jgi:hypothetical protein
MNGKHKVATSYTSTVEWVSVDTVELNHPDLQRSHDEGHSRRIAASFDPDALGKPLVVAFPRRGGHEHLVAIDGQHRLRAVQLALGAGQLVECEVVRGVSVAHAAKLFTLRNTFKRPSALDVFLKSVIAGEEESKAINAIVESFGLKVHSGNVDNYVNCVAALQRIYRGDGSRTNGKHDVALKRTLGTALKAWGRTATSFQGNILHGLGLLILKHGDVIEYDVLEHKLAAFPKGPIGLLGKAKGSKETMGGSLPNNVAATVVREYNKSRRKNVLPDWFVEG